MKDRSDDAVIKGAAEDFAFLKRRAEDEDFAVESAHYKKRGEDRAEQLRGSEETKGNTSMDDAIEEETLAGLHNIKTNEARSSNYFSTQAKLEATDLW